MTYNVVAVPKFSKEFKKLAKKYPSLKTEFSVLLETLENQPEQGIALGKNCYKIRLAIKSKGKGKVVGQGSLPILLCLAPLFTFLPFTINPIKKTSVIKNWKSF